MSCFVGLNVKFLENNSLNTFKLLNKKHPYFYENWSKILKVANLHRYLKETSNFQVNVDFPPHIFLRSLMASTILGNNKRFCFCSNACYSTYSVECTAHRYLNKNIFYMYEMVLSLKDRTITNTVNSNIMRKQQNNSFTFFYCLSAFWCLFKVVTYFRL